MHFLVGLADTAAETLRHWEQDEGNSEAGTLRLIRSTCKAVQKQCSQQAGCHLMFKAYLQSKGISVFPIAKFQGNRFNIIFYNAAGVYFLRNDLIQYLEELHHTRLNQLLQTVLRDLKTSEFIIGCRSLGIISKCITGPLWRLLESSKTMSEIGKVYQRMHRLLIKWSEDPADLMSGKGLSSEDDGALGGDDCVLSELLRPDEENDQSVSELLGMLCKSFSLVSERMLRDHLQDGIYSEMSPAALDSDTVNLPKTNVCSERDFALLDR